MRRCLTCNVLIQRGSRCSLCRKEYRPAEARHQLPQATKERDGYRCRSCGGTTNLKAHHIIAVSEGGAHTLDNLITLCHDCHEAAHHGYATEIA